MNKEKILCAAIWYKDLEPCKTLSAKNIDKGIVVLGHRHGHVIQTVLALTGLRTVKSGKNSVGNFTQGFLTSKNNFLDRKEAWKLFKENGGNPEFKNLLYSEDLY